MGAPSGLRWLTLIGAFQKKGVGVLKAQESKYIIFFLFLGAAIGAWFAGDQPFLSALWAQEFFSAQSAVSVFSTLIFRVISAESRYRSNEQTKNIESLTKEIASIIPAKFKESARLLEKRFKKVEHEANIRYNRQMMSQEEDVSEFWHFQQDFGREKSLNIYVNHKVDSSEEYLQDDYKIEILGTYESVVGGFSKVFYIVRVLKAYSRGTHEPVFSEGEQLACSYSNKPRISRVCDHFGESSYEFHIGGRIGTITYDSTPLAKDVSFELRLVDQLSLD